MYNLNNNSSNNAIVPTRMRWENPARIQLIY
jgi:hypothetical protein